MWGLGSQWVSPKPSHDSYGSTNYDEYETDYDQEYVDIEADLDYESHSDYDTADYDDQNNQQGETYFTTYCTIALLTYLNFKIKVRRSRQVIQE